METIQCLGSERIRKWKTRRRRPTSTLVDPHPTLHLNSLLIHLSHLHLLHRPPVLSYNPSHHIEANGLAFNQVLSTRYVSETNLIVD